MSQVSQQLWSVVPSLWWQLVGDSRGKNRVASSGRHTAAGAHASQGLSHAQALQSAPLHVRGALWDITCLASVYQHQCLSPHDATPYVCPALSQFACSFRPGWRTALRGRRAASLQCTSQKQMCEYAPLMSRWHWRCNRTRSRLCGRRL